MDFCFDGLLLFWDYFKLVVGFTLFVGIGDTGFTGRFLTSSLFLFL